MLDDIGYVLGVIAFGVVFFGVVYLILWLLGRATGRPLFDVGDDDGDSDGG